MELTNKQQQKMVDYGLQVLNTRKEIESLKLHISEVRKLRNKWKAIREKDYCIEAPAQLGLFATGSVVPVRAEFITAAMVKEYLKCADMKLRRLENRLVVLSKKFQ